MTAELAAAMPVLTVVVAVAVSAVAVAGARVRVADASREAARAAARDDPGAARALTEQVAPGATLVLERRGALVVATVRLVVRPLGGWLPALTVSESATAAAEPAVH
ncbi:MAG TPA: TadE family type IV pilus minor pilin [Jatrophihabitantaceae bacterium]|nr:TadE family type IV pilus minor pilin [Jatrophihabitantaceae bacterium]